MTGNGMRGWVRAPALALLVAGAAAAATGLPAGWWPASRSQPIVDKTRTIRLAPDLSALSAGERAALDELIAAGGILQRLHEDLLHRDAARARAELAALARREPASAEVRNLTQLYEQFQGPIASTLENRREPFLAVDSLVPGKHFYPWGVTKAELDAFLAAHPGRRADLLDVRTVVRRADAASLRADLAALDRHPALELLHPGLRGTLETLARSPSGAAFYAVPYPVAHADSTVALYRRLRRAADAIEPADRDFAGYLRHRARDLLANDYEAGDASWVKGRFGRLNAQIGAYETYDDELYGVKASYGMSLMLTDEARTRAVREAIRGLQELEDALPCSTHKRVIEDIPVGVYDVIADFGQARGANTATILPNESEHARRYGRTILMRRNILTHSDMAAAARRSLAAAVDPAHAADYDPEGSFYRVLWHEIGHYLGPDRDRRGRELDDALEARAATFEEMKSDLVSLFVAPRLLAKGYYDERRLRALYVSGVLRMLNKNRPRPDQSYGVMTLMQLNWFLDRGALVYDAGSRKLTIRYERYHDAVASLIEQVLALQLAGDREAAERFIARWTAWDERHQALSSALRAAETNRYWRVTFAALGD